MTIDNVAWRENVRDELVGNILPFWAKRTVDPRGGFYGFIGQDLTVDPDASRSAVLNTRILWTFSTALRMFGDTWRPVADHAFAYIRQNFVDPVHGGLFWMLDGAGKVESDRKQIYAQAFGIYGLAEYHRATGNPESLQMAQQLFHLIEAHSHDAVHGGYIEARARDWSALADQRLSEKDLNSPKSMNTHLHIMEGYTNLLRVWRDPELVARQTELMNVFFDHILDARTRHLKLFFDMDWSLQSPHLSYGHDIEASWLLVEAAEVLGDAAILQKARDWAVAIAGTVYAEGLDSDGSIFYEAEADGTLIDPKKHWWAQAEATVGFYNAYQLSQDARFLEAAQRLWGYIKDKVVDHVHGEWHAKLTPDGRPLLASEDGDVCLVGPWKCPYHNARLCFELVDRLG